MPARKPSSLSQRHDTLTDRAARTAAETAMTPRVDLPARPPAALKGHKIATAEWKSRIDDYAATEGTILTAFDVTLLTRYCLAVEDFYWLADIRDEVEKAYKTASAKLAKVKHPDDMQAYYNALSQVNALLARLQGFDARLDGKSKLIHALEQSLYLTPRSRAGVAPTEKEAPGPVDDMEALLGE